MALTLKQRVFVDEYLVDFNATQAAIRAGYSEKTARSIGQENLTKPDIATEISQRVSEKAISADEALLLLADFARGSLGDIAVFQNGAWKIDLQQAQKNGKLHLIKSIKNTRYGLQIELEDRQAALDKILRVHGVYRDKLEHDLPQDTKDLLTPLLKAAVKVYDASD